MGEMMFDLFDLCRNIAQFLLVFLNIEPGDPAHRQCQQLVDVFRGDVTFQPVTERRQSVENLPVLLLLTFTLLDPFVDPVLEKELCQRFGMGKFILPCQIDLKFPAQVIQQFLHVALQHFGNGHLPGFAVANNDHFGRDRNGTVGVHIQPLPGLFRIITAGRGDADLHMVAGKVADIGNADLVFICCFFDRSDQAERIGRRRNFPDDQIAPLNVDFGTQGDFAVAVIVFAHIHNTALLKIRVELKRFTFQFSDLRLDQLVEVVRQNGRGHTDGDTVTAHHQQTGDFCRQQHRLFFSAVVVGDKFGDVVVEHRFVGKPGQ